MHLSVWLSSRPSRRRSSPRHAQIHLCLGRALGSSGRTDTESVAELAGDGLEVSHAAGTGGLPSLGLLAPVDCAVSIMVLVLVGQQRAARERTLAGLGSRVTARSAGVLLNVEGATTCSSPSQFRVQGFRVLRARNAPSHVLSRHPRRC